MIHYVTCEKGCFRYLQTETLTKISHSHFKKWVYKVLSLIDNSFTWSSHHCTPQNLFMGTAVIVGSTKPTFRFPIYFAWKETTIISQILTIQRRKSYKWRAILSIWVQQWAAFFGHQPNVASVKWSSCILLARCNTWKWNCIWKGNWRHTWIHGTQLLLWQLLNINQHIPTYCKPKDDKIER